MMNRSSDDNLCMVATAAAKESSASSSSTTTSTSTLTTTTTTDIGSSQTSCSTMTSDESSSSASSASSNSPEVPTKNRKMKKFPGGSSASCITSSTRPKRSSCEAIPPKKPPPSGGPKRISAPENLIGNQSLLDMPLDTSSMRKSTTTEFHNDNNDSSSCNVELKQPQKNTSNNKRESRASATMNRNHQKPRDLDPKSTKKESRPKSVRSIVRSLSPVRPTGKPNRNFRISTEAKEKQAALLSSSSLHRHSSSSGGDGLLLDSTAEEEEQHELAYLPNIVGNLRRVEVLDDDTDEEEEQSSSEPNPTPQEKNPALADPQPHLSSERPNVDIKKKTKKTKRKASSVFDRKAPSLYPTMKTKTRCQSVRSVSPVRPKNRNFQISLEAKQQDELVSSSRHQKNDPMDQSEHELSGLQTIITQLKKVQLPDISKVGKNNKKDKSNEQASEILEIIRNLRRVETDNKNKAAATAGQTTGTSEEITATMESLQKAGYLRPGRMEKDELNILEDTKALLQKVYRRMEDRQYMYHCQAMDSVIRKIRRAAIAATTYNDSSSSSSDSSDDDDDDDEDDRLLVVQFLEDAIDALQTLIRNLYDEVDKKETQHAITSLQDLVPRIRDREVGQLAGIIQSLSKKSIGGDGGNNDANKARPQEEELARVIANLKSLCEVPIDDCDDDSASKKRRSTLVISSSNLSDDDTNFLGTAIKRLKNINMRPKQADGCVELIQDLRMFGSNTANEDSLLLDDDDRFVRLRLSMTKEKWMEIKSIFGGLQKINLSDRDWNQYADKIRETLRTRSGDNRPQEIADVINRLRKVKMNKRDAKEIGVIMFQLRKTNYDKLSPEEQEREKIKLRKVLPKELDDELFDMVWNLRHVTVNEDDTTNLEDALADLGDGSDSHNESSVTEEGQPVMTAEEDMSPEDGGAFGWDREVNGRKTTDDSDFEEGSESSSRDDILEPENGDSFGWDRNGDGGKTNSDFEEGSESSSGDDILEPENGDTFGWDREGNGEKTDDDSDFEEGSESSSRDDILEAADDHATERLKPSRFFGNKGIEKKSHYSCLVMEEDSEDPTKQKLIVFNQKPQWKHKKHNNCVVGDKRWRFEEGFGVDEVVYSSLTRDQYDRRKKISASLFATLDDDAADSPGSVDKQGGGDEPHSPCASDKRLEKFMKDGVKKLVVDSP